MFHMTRACHKKALDGKPGAQEWKRGRESVRVKLAELEKTHAKVMEAKFPKVSGAATVDLSDEEVADMCPYFNLLDAYLGDSPKHHCFVEGAPCIAQDYDMPDSPPTVQPEVKVDVKGKRKASEPSALDSSRADIKAMHAEHKEALPQLRDDGEGQIDKFQNYLTALLKNNNVNNNE